jgi:hypothetical protein
LSNQASILKENAEFLYTRFLKTVEGLMDEEALWRPSKEAHNIEWQLNHVSRITNLSIPRLLKGDREWQPDNWPMNYREANLSISDMIKDIEKGSKLATKLIGDMTEDQLEKDTKYWGGTRKLKEGLFAYLAEVAHHKGQIAYIRGTYGREHGKQWKYP